MNKSGTHTGGGAAGLLPPPEQNVVVLFLISNYENALRLIRRRHFPCQFSFKIVSDGKHVIFIQEHIFSYSYFLGYVPSCRGYVPSCRGFVSILRGFVPNLRGFVPNLRGFVPNDFVSLD